MISLYDIGENLYTEGRFEEALRCFQEVYEKEEELDALNYIGCCQMNLGEYQEALNAFDLILSETLWERALFNKGRVYLKLRNYSEALAHFNRAAMVNPENDEVCYYLGVYHEALEDYETCKTYYERAISINDKESEYYLNLGVACYRSGEYERAVEILDACIAFEHSYTKTDALFNKGVILYEEKQYEDSLQALIEAQALAPKHLEIMNMVANVFYRLRKYDESLLWIDKVLSIDNSDKEALRHKQYVMKATMTAKNKLSLRK